VLAHAFEVRDRLPADDLFPDLGFLVLEEVGEHDHVALADHFRGAVAEDLFGAAVPRQNDSVGGFADDCRVGRFDYRRDELGMRSDTSRGANALGALAGECRFKLGGTAVYQLELQAGSLVDERRLNRSDDLQQFRTQVRILACEILLDHRRLPDQRMFGSCWGPHSCFFAVSVELSHVSEPAATFADAYAGHLPDTCRNAIGPRRGAEDPAIPKRRSFRCRRNFDPALREVAKHLSWQDRRPRLPVLSGRRRMP